MGSEWLIEFLLGTGKLFLHPLFYFSFYLCIVLGYRRVKRERKDFKIRVESGYFELKNLLPIAILIGLALSIITIISGLVIPFAAIIIICAVTIFISLTFKVRLLSPAYVIGSSIFILFFLFEKEVPIPYLGDAIANMETSLFPSLAVLMGLLMIAESILIKSNGAKGTSPMLITSNRGMTVGAHQSKKLWLLPLFLFIPGGDLPLPFDWWPVFELADNLSVTLILVPFLMGFSQKVQARLPEEAISMTGTRVLMVGFVVLAVAIGSIWMPILSIIAATIAILGRELIHYFMKMNENRLPFYFTKKKKGVLILGIIPNSPADKMGLSIGEVITKVNGQAVQSEKQFYEALQKNRAHCRLEVFDVYDQIRFVQRALFEGEHYELGIIFIQEKANVKQAI